MEPEFQPHLSLRSFRYQKGVLEEFDVPQTQPLGLGGLQPVHRPSEHRHRRLQLLLQVQSVLLRLTVRHRGFQ